MAAGGDQAPKKEHFAHTNPARARFDHAADQLFFTYLWRRVEAATTSDHERSAKAKTAFIANLREKAEAELKAALPAMPCTAIQRPRAEARAWRAFYGAVWKEYPELFEEENANAGKVKVLG